MIRFLFVLTVALGSVSRPAVAQALLPDTALAPPTGPRLVLLEQPGTGLAALRLFVPLPAAADGGASGVILRDLALARMRALAGPVGARVSAARTPWGLAYRVQGAATDLDYLVDILRAATAEPLGDDATFLAARDDLTESRARAAETPAGKLTATLRAAIEPDAEPGPAGAPTAERVRDLWRRVRDPSSMTLVVAAPGPLEVVLAATRGWGDAETGASAREAAVPEPSPTTGRPRPPRVDVLRRWYGAAWQGGSAGDPRGAVAAVLLSDAVRRRAEAAGYEASVELIELADRWALVVTGAAYANKASAMRREVEGALEAVRDALDEASVTHAVSQVRAELLFRSRTPAGLVSTVGRAMEASGDPAAADRQLAALDRTDVASMGEFLSALIERGPVTAQVRP